MKRDLRQLQAHNDLQEICDLTIKWSKASSNPEIISMRDAIAQTIDYVIHLETMHGTFDAVINKALDEKHEAIKRAKDFDKLKAELATANAQLSKFYA